MHDTSWLLEAELNLRLALAIVLGSVLGWERQMRQQPAGLRTHMMVSLGAAAYTIAGTYGVAGFGTVQDAGRVASQIVTGIGFIGAGTIWRSSGDARLIRGLTTAASIWVAASIGMLCGYGLYVLAAGCAIQSLVVLRLLKVVVEGEHLRLWRRLRRSRPAAARPPASDALDGDVSVPAPASAPALASAQESGLPPGLNDLLQPQPAPDGRLGQSLAVDGVDGRAKRKRKSNKGKNRRDGGKRKRRDADGEPVDEITDAS